jgi:hypothetical protein
VKDRPSKAQPQSKSQRLILWLLTPFRDSVRRESEGWVADCPECQKATSIWDVGGIRWKATGNPRRLMCWKHCGKKFFGKLVYRDVGLTAKNV